MTETTKSLHKKYRTWLAVSILLTVLPVLIFTILAFIRGTTGQKVVMGICVTTSILFVALNVVLKRKIRCTIWLLLIGIYSCLSSIMPLLFVMTATVALDEFMAEPLYKRYKQKYIINKEIDARGKE